MTMDSACAAMRFVGNAASRQFNLTTDCRLLDLDALVNKGSSTTTHRSLHVLVIIALEEISFKMKRKWMSLKEKLQMRDIQETGTWVQCCKASCMKWRYLPETNDPASIPNYWTCANHPDERYNSCDKPEEEYDESEHIVTKYTEGSVIWAKMAGFPWWPGMIEIDPDYEEYYELMSEQSMYPSSYHVVFFDEKVSRAWISTSCLKPFHEMKLSSNPRQLFVKGHNYKKAVTSAVEKAELALTFPIKERLSKFSFSKRYSGKWGKVTKFSDSEGSSDEEEGEDSSDLEADMEEQLIWGTSVGDTDKSDVDENDTDVESESYKGVKSALVSRVHDDDAKRNFKSPGTEMQSSNLKIEQSIKKPSNSKDGRKIRKNQKIAEKMENEDKAVPTFLTSKTSELGKSMKQKPMASCASNPDESKKGDKIVKKVKKSKLHSTPAGSIEGIAIGSTGTGVDLSKEKKKKTKKLKKSDENSASTLAAKTVEEKNEGQVETVGQDMEDPSAEEVHVSDVSQNAPVKLDKENTSDAVTAEQHGENPPKKKKRKVKPKNLVKDASASSVSLSDVQLLPEGDPKAKEKPKKKKRTPDKTNSEISEAIPPPKKKKAVKPPKTGTEPTALSAFDTPAKDLDEEASSLIKPGEKPKKKRKPKDTTASDTSGGAVTLKKKRVVKPKIQVEAASPLESAVPSDDAEPGQKCGSASVASNDMAEEGKQVENAVASTAVTHAAPPKKKKKATKPKLAEYEATVIVTCSNADIYSFTDDSHVSQSTVLQLAKKVSGTAKSTSDAKSAPRKKVSKPFLVKPKMDEVKLLAQKDAIASPKLNVPSSGNLSSTVDSQATKDTKSKKKDTKSKKKEKTAMKAAPDTLQQKKKKVKPFQLKPKTAESKPEGNGQPRIDATQCLSDESATEEITEASAADAEQTMPTRGDEGGSKSSTKSKVSKLTGRKPVIPKVSEKPSKTSSEDTESMTLSQCSHESSTPSIQSWEEFLASQEQVVPKPEAKRPGKSASKSHFKARPGEPELPTAGKAKGTSGLSNMDVKVPHDAAADEVPEQFGHDDSDDFDLDLSLDPHLLHNLETFTDGFDSDLMEFGE